MNQFVDSARTARQKLATALGLLQSPGVESFLDTVAEPVARAMGALHKIESSQGASLSEGGPLALAAIREALAILQSVSSHHPILEQVLEQVAGSLGLIHSLAQHQADASRQTGAHATPADVVSTQPSPIFAQTAPSVAPGAPVPKLAKTAPSITPEDEKRAQGMTFDRTAVASTSPMAHLEIPASPMGRTVETRPFEAPKVEKTVPSPQVNPAAQVAMPERPAAVHAESKHEPNPGGPRPGQTVVEANLGAHSPTNFYKGLSGNDVIADGGLFVATYNIPKMGSSIWLRVTLPGGYDFEAEAEVRWVRETGMGDSPPGFGAQLVALSAEARQLIQRYVRNREPLFHDDF